MRRLIPLLAILLGVRSAAAIVCTTVGGGNAWDIPSRAQVIDSSRATATTTTDALYCDTWWTQSCSVAGDCATGFCHPVQHVCMVPYQSSISAVSVEINRCRGSSAGVKDLGIRLAIDSGNLGSGNRATATNWDVCTGGMASTPYSGTVAQWGVSLCADDPTAAPSCIGGVPSQRCCTFDNDAWNINHPDFGVQLTAQPFVSTTGPARVDGMANLGVTFVPPTPTQTPSHTPTFTPVPPSPTFSQTPTVTPTSGIGQLSEEATATFTITPTETPTIGSGQLDVPPTPTPSCGPNDCIQCDNGSACRYWFEGITDGHCVYQAACLVNASGTPLGCASFTPTPTPAGPTPTPTATLGPLDLLSPVNCQIFKRDRIADTGTIPLNGTCGSNGAAIEASFNGGAYAEIGTCTAGSFNGSLTNQATGAGTLTVRWVTQPATTDTQANVGIGDVFGVSGYSNARGTGTNAQTYAGGGTLACKYTSSWATLTDPLAQDAGQPGSNWPLVASLIAADQPGVPLAFIPEMYDSETDGTELSFHLRTVPYPGPEPATTQYGKFLARVQASNAGGLTAVLLTIGAIDAMNGTGEIAFTSELLQIAADYEDDFGAVTLSSLDEGFGNIYDEASGPTRANLDAIRRGQIQAWIASPGNLKPGAPLYQTSNQQDSFLRVHFFSNAAYTINAGLWWGAIKSALYAGTDEGRGPQMTAVVQLSNTVVDVHWTDASLPVTSATPLPLSPSAFRVTDNVGTLLPLSSAVVVGADIVRLTLSGAGHAPPLYVSYASKNDAETAPDYLPAPTPTRIIVVPRDSSSAYLPAEPFQPVVAATITHTPTPGPSQTPTQTFTPANTATPTPTGGSGQGDVAPTATMTLTPTITLTPTLTPTQSTNCLTMRLGRCCDNEIGTVGCGGACDTDADCTSPQVCSGNSNSDTELRATGADWNTLTCTSVDSTTGNVLASNSLSGTFDNRNAVICFDTGAALPETTTVISGALTVFRLSRINTNNQSLTADYVDVGPSVGCEDWIKAPSGAAFSVLLNDTVTGNNTFTLNPGSLQINHDGLTCLRLGVTGGQPTGNNLFGLNAVDFPVDTQPAPSLNLCYVYPPNTPTVTPTGGAGQGDAAPTATPTIFTPTPTVGSGQPDNAPAPTMTVTPTPASIANGTVDLQGRPTPPASSWSVPLTITFYAPGGSTPLYTFTPTSSTSGTFTGLTGIVPGTYDVRTKNRHTLRHLVPNVVLNPGANSLNCGTLPEGDATNDNVVNFLDLSLLVANMSLCAPADVVGCTTGVGCSDFNESGCVNFLDLSLLVTNFGEVGE